jgi:O-antigen/teichoic acid export membrane protein
MQRGDDTADAAPSSSASSLGDQVMSGVRWKVVSQIVLQCTRIGVAILLARLLTPRDYGLAGMVLVFSALAVTLSDLALGAALVRRPTITENDRSTAFWLTIIVGIALTAIGLVSSGPIADFFGEPDVQPLLAAASLGFVVTALGATQAALLTRDMDFRGLEIRMMGGVAVSAVVAVTVALRGGGAWAIIAQELTLVATSTALLWFVSAWRPQRVFSRQSARELSRFGGKVFGINLLNYANRNADNLLIGRFLGANALGAYALAYNIMLLPLTRIVSPIRGVLFPALARIQDDRPRVARSWLRANRLVAAVTMPAMLFLMVLAPDVLPVVVGPRWDDAIPVVQILAWVGLVHSLQQLNGSVLQAIDRAGTQLWFTVAAFAAAMVAFFAGLQGGIVGVALALAIAMTLVQPVYTAVTARAIGLSLADVGRSLGGVAVAAVAAAVALFCARLGLIEVGASRVPRLIVLVPLGAVAYLVLCRFCAPGLVDELRTLRARRGTRAAATDAAVSTHPSPLT